MSNTPTYQELQIRHPRFGEYTQRVYEDVQAAGHLALATEGQYGWGMPTDPATEAFVEQTTDKVVLDVGSGLGHATVLPALEHGAATVFATDVSFGDLEHIRKRAGDLGRPDALQIHVLNPYWWDRPLSANPTVRNVLGADPRATDLPADGTVDLMIARHSLQFGDPATALRFFDLAAAALKRGGTATAINFTPYTEYLYRYDKGRTQRMIEELNEVYAKGGVDLPGGYLHPNKSELKLSLAALMGKPELDRGDEDRFLYFDSNTVIGLFRDWAASRHKRGLGSSLVLRDLNYFSPPSIAAVNKLVSNPERAEKENFAFDLQKMTD